ncbi:MAG: hypothetical protein HY909_02385 [Deltaproteobacteria bacterium]|nr:hypothetical protein [Deltaproteobacteria bacterium]
MDPHPARHRIWCEMLPHETLRAEPVLALLARYGLEPLVAVRPGDLGTLPETLRALTGRGLPVALWPMLEDAHGRWPSARNAERFGRFTDEVLAIARALPEHARPRELVFDLEPSYGDYKTWLALARARRPPGGHPPPSGGVAVERARALFQALAERARGDGLGVSSAVMPMVLWDPEPPSPGPWQRWLGTPVDGMDWDHASVMLYTSIFEGWSRGLFSRRDSVAFLAEVALAASRRFGPAAGVSLGAVGVGALGDEPTYRSPEELAGDASVARGLGVRTLSLFDLGGVLSRPPAEAWLDAFTHPDAPRDQPTSARARALVKLLRGAALAAGHFSRR